MRDPESLIANQGGDQIRRGGGGGGGGGGEGGMGRDGRIEYCRSRIFNRKSRRGTNKQENKLLASIQKYRFIFVTLILYTSIIYGLQCQKY